VNDPFYEIPPVEEMIPSAEVPQRVRQILDAFRSKPTAEKTTRVPLIYLGDPEDFGGDPLPPRPKRRRSPRELLLIAARTRRKAISELDEARGIILYAAELIKSAILSERRVKRARHLARIRSTADTVVEGGAQ
jgi:hypothetical protein